MPISTTDVPPERKFDLELDPQGRLDYTIDWSTWLGNDDIEEAVVTLSPESSTAGLVIDSETSDAQTTTLRLSVDPANQDDATFDAPGGVELAFKYNLTDTSGQIWEFTYVVTVVQQ